ncbi:bifunctional DNA primase/polymerase [Streptomyces sp. NPDC056437]|uniref:bifunctional DNA primase/polymerase n=1 Tax=Streptomyces sp. NPDC056437 TaxID=3345816 RepID=UPI0036B7EAB3
MPAELRFPRRDSGCSAPDGSVAAAPLTIATWCAGQGWPVHPLAPGRKFPAANCAACRQTGHTHHGCNCRIAGRWCHGFHAATLNSERIQQWWDQSPKSGVGVACGPAGLVVIDIDAHAQIPPTRDRLLPGIPISHQVDLRGLATGYHTIGILAALRGATSPADDATTLRVRTPSGGLHVWYRSDGARAWQCSSGSGGGRALAWQVDVRAHGGYIIAPGTTTNAGTYTPVGDSRLPAPLPNWLARELERTGHLPAPQVPSPLPVPARALQAVIAAGGGRTHATRTLATVLNEVTACAAVTEGAGFSAKLNRAAYTAGGLVTGEYITEQQARNALREAAEAARPGQSRRSEGIIRSGMNAGRARPLHPGGRP